LGYVGLPVALAFARAGFAVVGYDMCSDLNARRQRQAIFAGERSPPQAS
jgi:UDP-N-acetyl-D-mannosaminuronate dehydrogenase